MIPTLNLDKVASSTWTPPEGTYQGTISEIKFDPATATVRLIVNLPLQPGLTQDHCVANNYLEGQYHRLIAQLTNCFGRDRIDALNNNGGITPEDLKVFIGKCVKVRIALKDYGQKEAFRYIERLLPCTEPLPVNPVHSISPGIVLKQMETLMADLRAAHAAMGL